MLTISDKLTLGGFSVSGLPTSRRHNRMNKLLEMHACLRVLKDTGFVFFTAQCTLVHMRGLGIACRPSVRPSVRLSVRPSVTLVDCDHIGWKSWKLITRATSPTPSLFAAKRRSA